MLAALVAILLPILAACSAGPVQTDLAEAPGTVELNQAPPNDVPFGGGGTGTVFFHGKIYHFAIGGIGIDGSAVAIIQTSRRGLSAPGHRAVSRDLASCAEQLDCSGSAR